MSHPQDESAAILNHYFAQLARASGLRWSPRNAADIERAVALMGQDEAPLDEVPPYVPAVRSDRVTQVLERDPSGDYGDANFRNWRQRRAVQDEETERLLRREGGAR